MTTHFVRFRGPFSETVRLAKSRSTSAKLGSTGMWFQAPSTTVYVHGSSVTANDLIDFLCRDRTTMWWNEPETGGDGRLSYHLMSLSRCRCERSQQRTLVVDQPYKCSWARQRTGCLDNNAQRSAANLNPHPVRTSPSLTL